MPSQNRFLTKGPPEKWLLVEGQEDFHTICQLLDVHKIHDGVTIEGLRGYNEVKTDLRVRMKAGDQTNLGIIVDADVDFGNRWRSIRDAMVGYGYRNVPELPDPNGTIVQREGNPSKFGVWIMPDNVSEGLLESFLRYLVPGKQEPVWNLAVGSVDAATKINSGCTAKDYPKAHLYTWLAWQSIPGQQPGKALTKGILNPHSPHAAAFVKWFRELYQL